MISFRTTSVVALVTGLALPSACHGRYTDVSSGGAAEARDAATSSVGGSAGATTADGGMSGHGNDGSVNPCLCTGDGFGADCTTALERYCSPSCTTLDEQRKKVRMLLDTDSPPIYAECSDETARFDWATGGENEYTLAFDRVTGALTYARKTGYVLSSCGHGLYFGTLTSGTRPGSSDCRRCRVAMEAGWNSAAAGAGGVGAGDSSGTESLPWCLLDSEGRIAMPDR